MLYGLLQAASTASNKGADDDDDQEDEEDVAQDEIEETVKPFTSYLLQLEKVSEAGSEAGCGISRIFLKSYYLIIIWVSPMYTSIIKNGSTSI